MLLPLTLIINCFAYCILGTYCFIFASQRYIFLILSLYISFYCLSTTRNSFFFKTSYSNVPIKHNVSSCFIEI